jgi:hypothetical protein
MGIPGSYFSIVTILVVFQSLIIIDHQLTVAIFQALDFKNLNPINLILKFFLNNLTFSLVVLPFPEPVAALFNTWLVVIMATYIYIHLL